jgi:hypothetical protein
MVRSEQIAKAESELNSLRQVLEETIARLRGKEVELATLKASLSQAQGLSAIPKRTDAILEVLRAAPGTLSPSEVTARLAEAGRDEDVKLVASLLSYLLKEGHVEKPSRGRYFAA